LQAKDKENTMITPRQVSDSINVPPSTIRRWSVRFEKHLSPRTGKKRTYTPTDLDTFRRIRDLSASGFGLDRIESMLDVVERPQDKTTALLTLADFVQSLESAHSQVASLQATVDEQKARLDALESWLSLPWYKRIGKRPPTG
jgi:DNA-binding transcriptional MerR regulator